MLDNIQQVIETVLTARDERAAVFNSAIQDAKALDTEMQRAAATIQNQFNTAIDASGNALQNVAPSDFITRLEDIQRQFNGIGQTLSQGDLETSPRAINDAFEQLLDTLGQSDAIAEFSREGAVSMVTAARASEELQQRIEGASVALARQLNPQFDELNDQQKQLATDNALDIINNQLAQIGETADDVQAQYEQLAEAQEQIANSRSVRRLDNYNEALNRTGRSAAAAARGGRTVTGVVAGLAGALTPLGRAARSASSALGGLVRDQVADQVDELRFRVKQFGTDLALDYVQQVRLAAQESSDFERAIVSLRNAAGGAGESSGVSRDVERIAETGTRSLELVANTVNAVTGNTLANLDNIELRLEQLNRFNADPDALVPTLGFDVPGESDVFGLAPLRDARAELARQADLARSELRAQEQQQAALNAEAATFAATTERTNAALTELPNLLAATRTQQEQINDRAAENLRNINTLIEAARAQGGTLTDADGNVSTLEQLIEARDRLTAQRQQQLDAISDREQQQIQRAADQRARDDARAQAEAQALADEVLRIEQDRQDQIAQAYERTTDIINGLQTDRERVARESADTRAVLEADLAAEIQRQAQATGDTELTDSIERARQITEALANEEARRQQQLRDIRAGELDQQRNAVLQARDLDALTSLGSLRGFDIEALSRDLEAGLRTLQTELDAQVLDIRFSAEIPDGQKEALIAEARALGEQASAEIAAAAAARESQEASDRAFRERQGFLSAASGFAGALGGIATNSDEADAQQRAQAIAQAESDLADAVEQGNQRQIEAAQNRLEALQRIDAQEAAQAQQRFENYQRLQVAISRAAAISAAIQAAAAAPPGLGQIGAYLTVGATLLGAVNELRDISLDGGSAGTLANDSGASGAGDIANQNNANVANQQQAGGQFTLRVESDRDFIYLDELDEWARELRRRQGANAPIIQTEVIV